MEDRQIGLATNGEIADIIEAIAPILDQYPIDHKLIALSASLLITLNPEITLDALKVGVDVVITSASKYVAAGLSNDVEWEDVPPSKLN